jgi:hypothetical protein
MNDRMKGFIADKSGKSLCFFEKTEFSGKILYKKRKKTQHKVLFLRETACILH